MTDFDFHDADGIDGFGADPEVAWNRDEQDPCEKGTVGCSVRHESMVPETDCETW